MSDSMDLDSENQSQVENDEIGKGNSVIDISDSDQVMTEVDEPKKSDTTPQTPSASGTTTTTTTATSASGEKPPSLPFLFDEILSSSSVNDEKNEDGSDKQPSYTTFSGIKKRTNSSHRRNYRSSQERLSACSNSDEDEDKDSDDNDHVRSIKHHGGDGDSSGNSSSSSSKKMKSSPTTTAATTTSKDKPINDDENSIGNDETLETSLPSPPSLPSPLPINTNNDDDDDAEQDAQNNEDEPLFSANENSSDLEWAATLGTGNSNEDDDEDNEDGERRRRREPASSMQRLFYHVRDLGNDDNEVHFEEIRAGSDSDSSSNSAPPIPSGEEDNDDEDESDSSSDCVLEDLDDPEGGTNANESKEAAASGAQKPSSNSESSSKPTAKKPKKKYEIPSVLQKPRPKYNWVGPREMMRREVGYRSNFQPQAAQIFRSKFYGSLYSVERLELMKKLESHHGCVNCLNFNLAGTKLASGSDDLFIKIWNYGMGKVIASFHSGHRANVFQAKFLPLVSLDTMIVSCARDNQVRLSELNTTGQVWASRKLAQHRGAAHKLSVNPQMPHIVLSCGEDSVVYNIDVREDKAQRILSLRERSKKVALYSIHQNPLFPYEFCISGRDEYVRIYDSRKLSTVSVPAPRGNEETREAVNENDSTPLKKFCPHHLIDSRHKSNVTGAVYSWNGREIVASYNDENIYLFDTNHSDGADCIKVYEGHRNSATIKGVNFFGDKSQFIVSGSDCGHVFMWDKETESIVNFFRADENGVVNCLEPHPSCPILATSGLDDDVKIWIPSKEKDPIMGPTNADLASTVYKNLKARREELERQPESMDGRIIQALWNHIRQANRERRREAGLQLSDSDDSAHDDEDEDDEDSSPRGVECTIA